MSDIDELCINTIRCLAMDAVQRADSGHPGMPMGAAPMGYLLFDRFMRYNPRNPEWFNRDRFLLSAGHGSMLLYSLLHLTGFDLPMEQLKSFRQWESMTPGHPEYGDTPGVETTTGPLGQGFGNGLGMAVAEAFLAATFNRPEGSDEDFGLIDHHTYVICSDGDLMEGVSHEAASLAGHLGLGKLICLYDDNDISIEGSTDLAFTEDVPARFEAYDWHVQSVADGNDLEAIAAAIEAAQQETQRPSLICVRTHIAYGSPMQDDAESHGAPLGPENVRAAKQHYGFPPDEQFYVPDEVREHMDQAIERGRNAEEQWNQRMARYRKQFPERAALLDRAIAGKLPDDWDADLPVFSPDDAPIATRNASGEVIDAMKDRLPTLIGGSADLAPSTKTIMEGEGDFCMGDCGGRNMHFGVREHAMAAMVNGMALHGGVIPFGATFLVFSDYMRPSLRLSALMDADTHWVFTHDSIGVGEDGPTHQPVEQLMSLRVMPNMAVIRPADANETAIAWKLAIERQSPVAMALTRQKLRVLDPERYPVRQGALRGGYVLAEAEGDLQVILVATGSEVALALEAREALQERGVGARVVSLPCWEIFEEQPEQYIDEVLPAGVPTLAIEAGSGLGWERWVGGHGDVIGLERFGASAPGDEVMAHLGFSVQNVVERAMTLVE
ncbi:MAG: transketolase [Armatimonadota bacterium]|nr:transketolase [Armatimonadota bacterium]